MELLLLHAAHRVQIFARDVLQRESSKNSIILEELHPRVIVILVRFRNSFCVDVDSPFKLSLVHLYLVLEGAEPSHFHTVCNEVRNYSSNQLGMLFDREHKIHLDHDLLKFRQLGGVE